MRFSLPSNLKARLSPFGLRILDFGFPLLALLSLFSTGLYLLTTRLSHHRFGFPLDDAWIYQTYARNLAQSGQWAFVPGILSAGATSILWTLLIVPIHWFSRDPRLWTHALGAVMLSATALGVVQLAAGGTKLGLLGVAQRVGGKVGLAPSAERARRVGLLAGAMLALEWHMAWAATSGMETLLFAALLTWYWALSERLKKRGFLAGLWGGALVLARPEGVIALALMGFYGLLFGEGRLSGRLRWCIRFLVGLALMLSPLFVFNWMVSGTLWPNTFYAKQAEYASLWGEPYWRRLLAQLVQPFIGAQVLLIPGVLIGLWRDRKRFGAWLPWAWAIAHIALYAARLPVTYQHGRYMMPIIPVVIATGMRGMIGFVRPRDARSLARIPGLVWLLSVVVAFPSFLIVVGAPGYASDARFIEDEMVAAARWVAENTPSDAVVAAHDIGALGYFAERPLVDLAGLASTDVIPVMHDDRGLLDFICRHGATYVVAFPYWNDAYERLLADPHISSIWSTDELTPSPLPSGLGRMTVYTVTCP